MIPHWQHLLFSHLFLLIWPQPPQTLGGWPQIARPPRLHTGSTVLEPVQRLLIVPVKGRQTMTMQEPTPQVSRSQHGMIRRESRQQYISLFALLHMVRT
jgi:hypothetical protein